MKLLLIVKYWNIEWEHKIVSEDVTIHNWRFLCFLVVTQLSLDHFCQLSCQLVNFHKFSIIFSKKITPSWKLSLARHFHMAPTSSLGRYLGIYFNSFQSTTDDFKCILQKAKQRMHNWEACFLPKPGRHTLIQSNLEALPAYVCSCSLPPHSIAKSVDSMHRSIFWRQQKDKNVILLISWNNL